MPLVKSFSVANSDMYDIKHVSDSITIVDFCTADSATASIIKRVRGLEVDVAQPARRRRIAGVHSIAATAANRSVGIMNSGDALSH